MRKVLIVVSAILIMLLMCGCENEETTEEIVVTSFEQIENMGKYEELSEKEQRAIHKYVISLDDDTAFEHAKEVYTELLKGHDELNLVSINVYKQPLVVDNGERPVEDLYIEMEVECKIDESIPYTEMQNIMDNWFWTDIWEQTRDEALLRFRQRNVIAVFRDYELKREQTYECGASSVNNKYFGIGPKLAEGEGEAIEAVDELLEGDRVLSLFGPMDESQLYVEIKILVPSDDDETELPKLAENIASALKTEKEASKYIETQGIETIKIVLWTSNLGNLEYVFEV